MLTFFTDESAADRGGAENYKLSIYGGLVLTEPTFYELTDFVYKLKDRYVMPQHLEIKWRFESFWENMRRVGHIDKAITRKTHPEAYESFRDDHKKLKGEVLDRIAESDAEIIVALRPNKLLGASDEQIVQYSIAAVARKFEKLLGNRDEFGIICADELPKRINPNAVTDYEYVTDLCCRGSGSLVFEHLISIIPTMNSHVSGIHQINDVVLGAIQYYALEFIRSFADPSRNFDTAKAILIKIIRNFHKAGGKYVVNNGLLMYPPKVTRQNTAAGRFLDRLEQQLKSDFGIL